jgi:hypothetical protein
VNRLDRERSLLASAKRMAERRRQSVIVRATMSTGETSVPFSIPQAYGGFAECHGVVRCDAEGLRLEFESKDGFLGVLKTPIRDLRIPLTDLQRIEFKPGWFSATLELQSRSLRTWEGVPGAEGSSLALDIARRDREAAAELASVVSLRVCERDLLQMQKSLEPPT